MLAKQMQGIHGELPEFVNLSTGQIRSKKPKKEKTPQEEAVAEMKKMHKKNLDWIGWDGGFLGNRIT